MAEKGAAFAGGAAEDYTADGESPGDPEAIRKAALKWRATTMANAETRVPPRKQRFSTWSDLDVPAVLTPADVPVDYLRDLGMPGEYPFTRGVQPTMYRGRLWTMRMFAGFGTPEQTNERFKYLLAQGQTGLSTAFDFPTLMGYDSDSPALARRGRHVRRRRRHAARHGGALRRHPARPGHDVDDHQRPGDRPARVLRRARRRARHPARPDRRHRPERLPQGVHRAARVARPAAAGDAHRDRHDRVLHARSAALEHRSASAAITSARPERRPRRSSRSRSPTASATCESVRRARA